MNCSESELRETFGSVGENVRVHRSCIIFGGKRIHIGSNVRIDCFTMLSAGDEGIVIGDHVHIAAGAYVFGSGGKVVFEDFSSVSSRVTLYTGTDDFLLGHMVGPTVPDKYRRVTRGDVILKKHSAVGSGSIVMCCTLGVGASIAALSFVKKNVPDFDIMSGSPAVKIGTRRRMILDLEKQLREGTKCAGQ
jgi:galactoside O-acetyltransferase